MFALLGDSEEPISTARLAELTGMHPNGVRSHLEQLWQAGLVDRGRSASRRGRPRDEWKVSETGTGVASAEPGVSLARWLARTHPTGEAHLRRVEAVGREAGLGMSAEAGENPEGTFLRALNRLGFAAEVIGGEKGFACRLGRCPFRDAARENSEVVCTLHRGMTRGLLESIDPDLQLLRFEARDPDRAGCLVEIGHKA